MPSIHRNKYSLPLITSCLVAQARHLLNRPNSPDKPSLPLTIASLILVAGLVFSLYGTILLLAFITPEQSNLWYAPWLSMLLIASFGIVFYFVRNRAPFIYGLIELSIALMLAWERPLELQLSHVSSTTYRETVLVMMTAGVYIFVRGIDTCRQALSQHALNS